MCHADLAPSASWAAASTTIHRLQRPTGPIRSLTMPTTSLSNRLQARFLAPALSTTNPTGAGPSWRRRRRSTAPGDRRWLASTSPCRSRGGGRPTLMMSRWAHDRDVAVLIDEARRRSCSSREFPRGSSRGAGIVFSSTRVGNDPEAAASLTTHVADLPRLDGFPPPPPASSSPALVARQLATVGEPRFTAGSSIPTGSPTISQPSSVLPPVSSPLPGAVSSRHLTRFGSGALAGQEQRPHLAEVVRGDQLCRRGSSF